MTKNGILKLRYIKELQPAQLVIFEHSKIKDKKVQF